MIKLGKKTLAILLVSALVAGYAIYSDATEFKEGAPEASFQMYIEEVGGTDEIVLEERVGANPPIQTPSLTVYSAGIPALDPDKQYTIRFEIEISADATGTASTTMTGQTAVGQEIKYTQSQSDTWNIPDVDISPGNNGVVESELYKYYFPTEFAVPLKGINIDGAEFDFTISMVGTNAEGAYSTGVTSGTIVIVEGDAGIIDISITGITTTVTEA